MISGRPQEVGENMNFTLVLLIISLHLMLFETKASKRTHQDVKEDDKHDEISDLGDNIRKRHLNHGCWRRNIKRKVSFFPSPLKRKAVRSRRISKRCFNYSPYDFDIPQVSYPCGGTCWPSGTDPWWPEYGWVDGCGYPPQGGGTWNNECGFPLQGGGTWNNECGYPLQGGGTWNQPPPWFPYGCGKWCCEYCPCV